MAFWGLLLYFVQLVYWGRYIFVMLQHRQWCVMVCSREASSISIIRGKFGHVWLLGRGTALMTGWLIVSISLLKCNGVFVKVKSGKCFWQLAGMCLVAAGIWVTVDGDSFMKVLPPFTDDFESHVNVGIFSITIGAVMTLLGLLGCCGAQKESKCLLIMVNLIHLLT